MTVGGGGRSRAMPSSHAPIKKYNYERSLFRWVMSRHCEEFEKHGVTTRTLERAPLAREAFYTSDWPGARALVQSNDESKYERTAFFDAIIERGLRGGTRFSIDHVTHDERAKLGIALDRASGKYYLAAYGSPKGRRGSTRRSSQTSSASEGDANNPNGTANIPDMLSAVSCMKEVEEMLNAEIETAGDNPEVVLLKKQVDPLTGRGSKVVHFSVSIRKRGGTGGAGEPRKNDGGAGMQGVNAGSGMVQAADAGGCKSASHKDNGESRSGESGEGTKGAEDGDASTAVIAAATAALQGKPGAGPTNPAAGQGGGDFSLVQPAAPKRRKSIAASVFGSAPRITPSRAASVGGMVTSPKIEPGCQGQHLSASTGGGGSGDAGLRFGGVRSHSHDGAELSMSLPPPVSASASASASASVSASSSSSSWPGGRMSSHSSAFGSTTPTAQQQQQISSNRMQGGNLMQHLDAVIFQQRAAAIGFGGGGSSGTQHQHHQHQHQQQHHHQHMSSSGGPTSSVGGTGDSNSIIAVPMSQTNPGAPWHAQSTSSAMNADEFAGHGGAISAVSPAVASRVADGGSGGSSGARCGLGLLSSLTQQQQHMPSLSSFGSHRSPTLAVATSAGGVGRMSPPAALLPSEQHVVGATGLGGGSSSFSISGFNASSANVKHSHMKAGGVHGGVGASPAWASAGRMSSNAVDEEDMDFLASFF